MHMRRILSFPVLAGRKSRCVLGAPGGNISPEFGQLDAEISFLHRGLDIKVKRWFI
jgi:hypothetical protein